MTTLVPAELAAIRERDRVWGDGDGMPTDDVYHDRRALLAHIDAITEAVEKIEDMQFDRDYDSATISAVLAILRGKR